MGDYLTKLQREMIMIVGCKGGAIREFVDETDDLTPDEARRLKSANTNMEKAMNSYCSRLDPKVKDRLRKELNESTMQVVVNREIAKQSSEKLVKEDDLYTLAEFITWSICQNVDFDSPFRCTVKEEGKPFRKCRLYNAMCSLGLARASNVKGKCPYKL